MSVIHCIFKCDPFLKIQFASDDPVYGFILFEFIPDCMCHWSGRGTNWTFVIIKYWARNSLEIIFKRVGQEKRFIFTVVFTKNAKVVFVSWFRWLTKGLA